MSENNPLKRIFDLYTSDLTLDEIDRLIKKESAEVYEFYKNQMPKVDTSKNKFQRSLIFARSLFNAFLLKMTAARRIFYIAALIIFFVGYVNDTGSYLILSFIIINLPDDLVSLSHILMQNLGNLNSRYYLVVFQDGGNDSGQSQ